MHVLGPQILKSARQLPPAERQDSIQKRQRPAEVNTMLMKEGVYNGNETASGTVGRKHHTQQNRRSFLDKFGGDSGRQADITTSPRDTLDKRKTAAGRI